MRVTNAVMHDVQYSGPDGIRTVRELQSLTHNGIDYVATGKRGQYQVFCRKNDIERFCKSFGNEGGFVYRDAQMIPLDDVDEFGDLKEQRDAEND